ncbi:MAG: hypothetical protein PHS44_08020 [Candidatus Dojkabacteria bacterium]|nr:hypothetical protein [Candidatus Dojkabacteria bacterium]
MKEFLIPTKMCGKCQGWGKIAGTFDECNECLGRGVYGQTDEGQIYTSFPSFVDFQSRIKVKTVKKLIAYAVGLCLFLVITVIVLLVRSII